MSGTLPPRSALPTVSQYTKDVLVLERSELCFEEVRAQKYFREMQEKEQRARSESLQQSFIRWWCCWLLMVLFWPAVELQLRQQEDHAQRIRCLLDQVHQELETPAGSTVQTSSPQVRSKEPNVPETCWLHMPDSLLLQPSAAGPPSSPPLSFTHPRPPIRPSSCRSLGLRLQTEPTFIQRPPSVPDPLQEVSQHPSVLPGPEPDVHEPVSLDQLNPSADVLCQSSFHSCGPSEPPV